METDLNGRVAVVTGGSRGIGEAAARRLAAAGAAVVVSGRDQKAIGEVTRSIEGAGGRAAGFAADVTDGGELERLREAAEAEFGPADILLAFAGGGGEPRALNDTTDEQWRQVVDGNLTSTFLTLRTFLPGMVERRRGAVITMSSTAGRQPGGASLAYAAAKAGVVMLTRQLAQEVAPSGVRINCLAPSTIVTERLTRLMPAEQRDHLAAQFPLRRLGTPDDVAEAALFLVSDRSGWITGVTLDITGGRVTA
jgi:3-oxoacyl-[acyl-carrier protein] reductase